MKQKIVAAAKKLDADLVGFAPASRFPAGSPLFRIFPQVKTVIGLGFRVLRGIYRGVEEGTTYYQYTTMGVENLEETVMPLALLKVSNMIEEEGFLAIPQRRNQLIMEDLHATNPEVDYTDVFRGITAENQLDFLECAVQCGLGEKGLSGSLLNREFGPFLRYCFILTDMELEPTQLEEPSLCDRCGACIEACPGHAISEDGTLNSWRCAVYYNGARQAKNPFMPPDALKNVPNRSGVLDGTAEFSENEAKEIMDGLAFYPAGKHFYRVSICGRACDRACYIHLEEKGLLTRSFHRRFREKEDWFLKPVEEDKE